MRFRRWERIEATEAVPVTAKGVREYDDGSEPCTASPRHWLVARLLALETVTEVVQVWSMVDGHGPLAMERRSSDLESSIIVALGSWLFLDMVRRKGGRCLGATGILDGGLAAFVVQGVRGFQWICSARASFRLFLHSASWVAVALLL
ncbi:hypothetical protein L484_013313 [Morus notabilis]|uniref:Uncharacterized protein n=1 Tax=Morus notabilis TaxID=981085 RepID=W9R0S4_9ROSA|nr:hypothetical protein L484_013313 [Morus notabilis]